MEANIFDIDLDLYLGEFSFGAVYYRIYGHNFVLLRRVSRAVKHNFRTYIRRYTTPNENFEYGYPHSIYPYILPFFRSISREVLEAAQTEHQRALKQEREARCDRVAEMLKEELLGEVLKEQVLNLATIEIR